jgi:hypothetical protein
MNLEMLKNHLVIMQGILYGFWNSDKSRWDCDVEYKDELIRRIDKTKAMINERS